MREPSSSNPTTLYVRARSTKSPKGRAGVIPVRETNKGKDVIVLDLCMAHIQSHKPVHVIILLVAVWHDPERRGTAQHFDSVV